MPKHLLLVFFCALFAWGCMLSVRPNDPGSDGAVAVETIQPLDVVRLDLVAPDVRDARATMDTPIVFDVGMAACSPGQDVLFGGFCVDCDPNGRMAWYWDGARCIELYGCTCRGQDCNQAYPDELSCTEAHRTCDPVLCARSGGTWYDSWQYAGCGFRCGHESNVTCDTPFPDCRCPAGQSFVSGMGCQADSRCSPTELCLGSEGTPTFCPVICGEPQECPGGQEACNCGPHRNFDPTRGCVLDPRCVSRSRETVCELTGGLWEDGICCDTTCGEYCPLECAAPACNCGRFRNFDPVLGCHEDFSCRTRHVGEACNPSEGMQCDPGRVCCNGRCEQPCCGSACDPITECAR